MNKLRIAVSCLVVLSTSCADEFSGPPVGEPAPEESESWNIQEGEFRPSASQEIANRPTERAEPTELLECPGAQLSEECQQQLVVHEWGTFTSVQSSKGEYLEGLHHEEERLPEFVHRLGTRLFMPPEPALTSKGLSRLPEPVTQKMETPVIYFYTDTPKTVDVSVGFPEGVISEWYPDARHHHASTSWREAVADGGMEWTVDITNEPSPVPDVPADDIWAPSRQVPDAAYVGAENEDEKYIFYRGVGTFEPPFSVRHDGERFTVENHSGDPVPGAYFLEVGDESGRITPLGDIEGFDSAEHRPGDAPTGFQPLDEMVEEAKTVLREGLVETGLTGAEARAMVETWEESYFRTPGNRVLYILPDSWTDSMLPMDLDPAPDELVRTLVGRVEVLTRSEEQQIADDIEQLYGEPDSRIGDLADHRFSEPRIRRGCQLVEGDEIEEWCLEGARELSRYPATAVSW